METEHQNMFYLSLLTTRALLHFVSYMEQLSFVYLII